MILMDMDMVHWRHYLLIATILCSLEHLMDQNLLSVYLDGLLHNQAINLMIPLKVRTSVIDQG